MFRADLGHAVIDKPNVLQVRAGDEVAIMAWDATSAEAVAEIATVDQRGPLFLTLTDGRTYSIWDGLGCGRAFGTRIRPAASSRQAASTAMAG